jgi:uncharacterized delta-60 repeat protein
MNKKIFILPMLMFCTLANAQSLITDTLFGNNGQISSLGAGWPEISGMLRQPDNKTILCGYTYDGGCNCYYNDMLRVDACGNIDSAFGINGYVHHTFDQRNVGADYVLQPDGKILVSGVQSDGNSGSQQFPFIARYKSDGSVDSTFGNNGTNKINYLGPGIFSSIYIMDSGKILCTGSPNGGSNLIMRFDSTGTVDNTFGTNGLVQHGVPLGVNFFYDFKSVMRNDGKIISIAPAYLGINNDKNVVLSCYDTLGVIDSTFGVNGYYIDYNFVIGNGLRMVLQSDDKIIVAQQNLPETAIIIARYNTNGSIDTTYGLNGYINIPAPNSPSRIKYLTIFIDDKILISYQENGVPPVFKKFDTNGILDVNFSLNGSNTFQFANLDMARTAIVSANDELLLGGCGSAFSMTRFVLGSTVPHITQNGFTLHANVSGSGVTYQWFLNGIAINGEIDSVYTATQTGSYMVEVTNSWGCTSSDFIIVTNTGIATPNSIDGVSFFPNPTANDIHIVNLDETELSVKLYDVKGRLIYEAKNTSKSQSLPMSHLSNGVYMIEMKTADLITKNKVIKQ